MANEDTSDHTQGMNMQTRGRTHPCTHTATHTHTPTNTMNYLFFLLDTNGTLFVMCLQTHQWAAEQTEGFHRHKGQGDRERCVARGPTEQPNTD